MLGLDPGRSWELGEPRGKPRDGRPQRFHTRSGWQISCAEGEAGSVNGFKGLARVLDGKEELLAELRDTYEMSIWWDGITDSEQPGFYFTIEALRRITALGCDVMGSAALVFGTESGRIQIVQEIRVNEPDRDQFEELFDSMRWLLQDIDGFEGASIARGLRRAAPYVLTTWWKTSEHADSAAFADWCAALPQADVGEPQRLIELSRMKGA